MTEKKRKITAGVIFLGVIVVLVYSFPPMLIAAAMILVHDHFGNMALTVAIGVGGTVWWIYLLVKSHRDEKARQAAKLAEAAEGQGGVDDPKEPS